MLLKNYHRNLPHLQSANADYFLTYRLAGSMPMNVLERLKVRETTDRFIEMDSYLDKAGNGPYWLKDPRIATEVYHSLIYLDKTKIDLKCFTIMSNHVHSLFSIKNPLEDLFKIMQSHKSFTAKKCNAILGRTGQFWETESFDHIVRKGQLENTIDYIRQNPVKAGLVKEWEEWPWTFVR
jgi:putative transposase